VKGIVAAPGMACALAFIVSQPEIDVRRRDVVCAEDEIHRFRHAVSDCHSCIKRMMDGLSGGSGAQTAGILDFQLLMLEDTDFIGKMEQAVSESLFNAEYAVKSVSDEYISHIEALEDNSYLKERKADVSDLAQRLIAYLSGVDWSITEPGEAYIAIGIDVAPSRFAQFDKSKLKGVILERGGITSHCVILSRSLGIPCLIGTTGIMQAAQAGGTALLDAVAGEAVMNPGRESIQACESYLAAQTDEKTRLTAYTSKESITLDGARIKVYANVASGDEALETVRGGGEGVGLFRSELLFMSRAAGPPSEEEQYAEYSKAAIALGDRPLVIRTLDAGGDKQIDYLDIGKEDNPFLGYRGIRYCIDKPDIFKPQIAAILRAAAVGNVRMMFPMITCKAEIDRAKAVVGQVMEELASQGKPFDSNIKIGIMVETPAAAFDAPALASEADFFSIGTNDLTQYLFAADRANANVAGLNSQFQPALLRVIRWVTDAAHSAGIEADICGQAAEAAPLIPLWVAMGVDNLSVSVPRITAVREKIRNLRKDDCVKLQDRVLKMDTPGEVESELGIFNEDRL